jgi:hypothetical protein
MKRIIAVLLVAFLAGNVQAQVGDSTRTTATTTTTTKTKYMYYPDANVYYNEGAKTYSYYDAATNTWMTNTTLPSTYTITQTTEKVPIMINGTTNVWSDNAAHQKKYRKAMKKMDKADAKAQKDN